MKNLLVAFLLGLTPSAYVLGAAPQETVTAQRFVVVDRAGHVRGSLDAAGLALQNAEGDVVARVAVAADGNPEIGLLGTDGKPRFRVGVGKDGVGFVLTDYAGNSRAGLVASDNGTSFTLTDPVTGMTRVVLSAERSGKAWVAVHDKDGEPKTTLGSGMPPPKR